MKVPKLTKTLVDNAPVPLTGDAYIWDTDVQGFGLRIQCSGRKVYVVRYRTRNGKATQRKMNLARCSDVAPDKAREMARRVFAQVAEGIDPAADRKPTSEVNLKTVGRMFEGYVASLRKNNRASATEVERALLKAKANAADALGRDKPAADISPTDVVNYVALFYNAGHRGAANKHRGYISSAYTWAMQSANDYTVPVAQRVDWGLVRNPVADVAKDTGATQTRDRNLSAEELRLLWSATDGDQTGFWPETAAVIRMLICCGQRVQETIKIEGAEIDLEAGVWNMPAHKTKGRKKPHVIPLPQLAIDTLTPLIAEYGDGSLFPARSGAKGVIMDHQSVMQAISRWLDQDDVDMPAFQTRDLRRTWKSRAHDAGVDRFTRDLLQQHAQGGDSGSKHYDRADYFQQMKEAMTKWEGWLRSIIAEVSPADQQEAA